MDPGRRLPHFFAQPLAFKLDAALHGLDVIDQRQDSGAIACEIRRLGLRHEASQLQDQRLAFAGSGVSHDYLMLEMRVSNILFTVVMTCDAAE